MTRLSPLASAEQPTQPQARARRKRARRRAVSTFTVAHRLPAGISREEARVECARALARLAERGAQ